MTTIKSLKLKSGICRRIFKEYSAYEKETEKELAKYATMKDSGADQYDLKQQENVLAESRMMIPDCKKRLDAALYDLQAVIVGAENDQLLEASKELEEAKALTLEVESVLEIYAEK